MKKRIGPRRSHVFILAVLLSIACGGQSLIPGMPTFPPIPPQPGTSNVPTGSSPLSGDWSASPDFGRLAFTVDPDGKNVTTVVIGVSNWSCGGTTLTTELQVLNPWPISDGQFAGQANLNGNFHTMIVKGSYDSANKQFSGTWEEDAHGTICSGKWESVSRK